jgi:CRP/FNR family transcriptional regulator
MPNRYGNAPRPHLVAVSSAGSFPARVPFDESAAAARPIAACAGCAMRNACMPADLSPSDLARFECSLNTKRRIAPGRHLYRAGDAARSLYAIRSGFIKTSLTTDDGREQVTGFQMMGDAVGLEAIGGSAYATDAVALELTEVCEIPFASLEELSRDVPRLQHRLYEMVAQEFQHDRESRVLLGTMHAEERLASFLLRLGRRYQARGYSARRFLLRMSRADIGSYLGLRLETVSRLFSKFQADGLLRIENRSVEILDATALKRLIGRAS